MGGGSYAETFTRLDSLYGGYDVTRFFNTGLPSAWSGNVGMSGRPVVVSFKADPNDVISGKHDTYLTAWFKSAPRDRKVWWSFYHEPEDNIEAGSFTAEQYRAAWKHLRALSLQAANPQLSSTLILMGWSVEKNSGRNWLDYYAGGDVIDTLGWDLYNRAWTKGFYVAPEERFRAVVDASKSVNKPWGMAEVGSVLAVGDDGTKRAAWLKVIASWFAANDAEFVTYFDANIGVEYRLLDKPSQDAWRAVVSAR